MTRRSNKWQNKNTSNNHIEELDLLVYEAKIGNKAATELLFRRLSKHAYAIAYRFLNDSDEAQEARQEIALKIFRNLDSFRGESKFSTWVYRIAINSLITMREKKRAEQEMSFEGVYENIHEIAAQEYYHESDTPHYQRVLEEFSISCSIAMIECLDIKAREAYLLGEIFDIEPQEAASILNISNANYRQRLSRARKNVLEFMSGHYKHTPSCNCKANITIKVASICKCKLKNKHGYINREKWQRAKEYIGKLNLIEERVRANKNYSIDLSEISP